MSSEEGIRPTPMVSLASSDAGTLVLLAQDGAQTPAYEAVEDAVQSWRGMFDPKSGSWMIACVGRIGRTVGDGHISAIASASPNG
jgi:hypothetical protein